MNPGHRLARDLEHVITSFKLDRFPIPIRVRYEITNLRIDGVKFGIRVSTKVEDRAGVGFVTLASTHFRGFSIVDPLARNVRWMQEWLRELVHAVVLHEADEQMLFDGVRVFDPHAGEPASLTMEDLTMEDLQDAESRLSRAPVPAFEGAHWERVPVGHGACACGAPLHGWGYVDSGGGVVVCEACVTRLGRTRR